jgi:hypothetical protein
MGVNFSLMGSAKLFRGALEKNVTVRINILQMPKILINDQDQALLTTVTVPLVRINFVQLGMDFLN